MISAQEISRSLYGAWRLARVDAGGMQFFDNNQGAFWRSFFAAAIVAPAYAALVVVGELLAPTGAAPGRLIAVEAIAFVLGWTAFPLAAFYVVTLLRQPGRYYAYIAAYNWAQVIETGLMLLAMLVSHAVLPVAAAPFVNVAVLGAVLAYEWFIAKTMLGVPGLAAGGLVFVGFVILLFLENFGHALLIRGVG